MTRRTDLEQKSRELAGQFSDLLNGTVCHGVRLTSVITPGHGRSRAVIGYKITKDEQDLRECIPIAISGEPRFWLGFSMRLEQDHEDKYLMVRNSVMLLSSSAHPADTLLHYDYERDKSDGYPDAHLQVCATSEAWERAGVRTDGSQRPLERLHLPVGGRRFRPTLEDVVEFLITDKLAESRDGWKEAVEDGRQRFQRLQLRAAIRRNPDVAREMLAEMDG